MNVLSLFDGISCGQVALERVGIKVDNYYASEVDKYAIQVTQRNYPNTIQLGDVKEIRGEDLPKIDLLIGGSPCQGFSFAGKQLNFDDERSKLFFEYVRILNDVKPKYFLLENVKMKKECQDVISGHLGVEPIKINSSLVSAQNRTRLYWTNIPDILPLQDKCLKISDVIDLSKQRHIIKINYPETIRETKNYAQYDQSLKGHNSQDQRYFYINGKVNTITTSRSSIPKIKIADTVYLCDADDVEIFQTLPHQYTEGLSDGIRCKLIGNGWTIDVIAHILRGLL